MTLYKESVADLTDHFAKVFFGKNDMLRSTHVSYHTGSQLRIRREYVSMQSRQSLHCSYTQSMKTDEGSDLNLDQTSLDS